MAKRTLTLDDRLYDYILEVSLREPPVLARLREETAQMKEAMMQISPDQGQFMRLLIELTGARRALEVGTFTGYSALSIALALPPDGKVVACDVSEAFTAVGRRYWQEAGVADKIDLRLAPAVESLDALIADGAAGSFDFAFIDADKSNYATYYERALTLLRRGGLVAVDNVLWNGAVVDPTKNDEDTQAIRALNRLLKSDDRVNLSLVPIGDGLTLARKL